MKRIIKLIVIIAWSGQIGGFQAEFPVVSLFKKEFVVWSINRIDNKNKHGTIKTKYNDKSIYALFFSFNLL